MFSRGSDAKVMCDWPEPVKVTVLFVPEKLSVTPLVTVALTRETSTSAPFRWILWTKSGQFFVALDAPFRPTVAGGKVQGGPRSVQERLGPLPVQVRSNWNVPPVPLKLSAITSARAAIGRSKPEPKHAARRAVLVTRLKVRFDRHRIVFT